MIIKCRQLIIEYRAYREKMQSRALVQAKLYMRFRFINKKHGGFMKKIENRMRHTFILGYVSKRHIFEDRAKLIVAEVFKRLALTYSFTFLLGELNHLVVFMQTKFKNRFIYREAKVEMMHLCWAKRLQDMKRMADEK